MENKTLLDIIREELEQEPSPHLMTQTLEQIRSSQSLKRKTIRLYLVLIFFFAMMAFLLMQLNDSTSPMEGTHLFWVVLSLFSCGLSIFSFLPSKKDLGTM